MLKQLILITLLSISLSADGESQPELDENVVVLTDANFD